MTLISIGELARESGLPPSALRYYERIGLVLPHSRQNGQRRYGPDALKRLAIINLAKRAGFRLEEIDILLNGFSEDTPPSARWKRMAEAKLPEIEELIARAEGMKRFLEEGMQCDCLSLDECASFIN